MTNVVMPQMGESVVEGTVTKWLKRAGDRVERDEPLFEISTEKVDTEVPSPAEGILSEILVEEGKTVAVASIVARIEDQPASHKESATSRPAPPSERIAPRTADIPATSAKVRETPPPAPASTEPSSTSAVTNIPPTTTPSAGGSWAPRTRIEPMSVMRQKIAEHMALSKHTAAHVTSVHRVDMTALAALRERQKKDFQARYGLSLTYLPFILAATSKALRSFPILNASVEGKNILYHDDVNIGIAVAIESGLIVPVVRNADEKNIVGLQRIITDLASRARSKRLNPDEVKGSTFSITNFGVFGTVLATPVINQPNVAILGVGAIEKTPVVIEDAIGIRSMGYLSLTYDHRLIDGATADQFTQQIKASLEAWPDEPL